MESCQNQPRSGVAVPVSNKGATESDTGEKQILIKGEQHVTNQRDH